MKKIISSRKENINHNLRDEYFSVDENLDLANGCVIVADVAVDIGADVAVDVVTDVVADAVADTLADAAADAAADVAADAAADAVGDAAADTMVDAVANGGVSTVSSSVLKNIGLVLGGAILDKIVTFAVSAIKNATKGKKPSETTAADYWSSLYTTMTKAIPCDKPSNQSCGPNQRSGQQAMILSFQANISKASPDAQKAAIAFEKIFTAEQQNELKHNLSKLASTGGIPSMVKYMESYTNPGAHGAPLVIATANTLIAVTNFFYTD